MTITRREIQFCNSVVNLKEKFFVEEKEKEV